MINTCRILLLISVVFILNSSLKCNTEKDDKCIAYYPVNADFKVIESFDLRFYGIPIGPDVISAETDTVYTQVLFKAKPGMKNYRWSVGGEQSERVGRKEALDFSLSDSAYGALNIRLIAEKTPDLACNLFDKAADTSYKTIYSVWQYQLPIMGKYYGSWAHRPDSFFTISIEAEDSNRNFSAYLYGLGQCGRNHPIDSRIDIATKSYLFVFSDTQCGGSGGYGVLDRSTRKLVIRYMDVIYTNSDNPDKRLTFTGFKTQ